MFELYHDILQPYISGDNLQFFYKDTDCSIESHIRKTVSIFSDMISIQKNILTMILRVRFFEFSF